MSPYEFVARCEAAFEPVKREAVAMTPEYVRLGADNPLKFGFNRGFDAGYRAAKAEQRPFPEERFEPAHDGTTPR